MFNDKNVILFGLCVGPNNSITPMGSLYDALEYFMQIYEVNPDIRLLFYIIRTKGILGGVRENDFAIYSQDLMFDQLRHIIDGKYDITDYSFMENIHIVNFKKLFLGNKMNKVMTIDLITPHWMKHFMCRANECIILPEWTDERYYYTSKVTKVTYYTEMHFCHSDVPYRMKMAFDKFKKIDSYGDKLYVNYPRLKIEDNPQAVEFIKNSGKEQLVKDDHFFYDLHERFDEYAYFKSEDWYDPHPRLFHECKWYDKAYRYFNPQGVQDGSYHRYHDSLTESIDDRMLTKDDIIVKLMAE